LGVPKITDFGLAKFLDQPSGFTQNGVPLGTPSYMAPEQAEGRSTDVGPATDVYALGAILYEMLTGRPPFKAETPLETLRQVKDEEVLPPSRLQPRTPRDLETICLKCLEKDPARRYASALELAEDLARFLAHRPVLARPPGTLYRLGKFARRHKGLVAGVSLLFLALTGGMVGTSLGLARARAAEQETRRLLVESYHDAARLAMRRGSWRDALANIDRALAAGQADSIALHLDRVRAWCALHETPRAVRELQALCRRQDLGDLCGRVLLWQADVTLGQPGGDERALQQVRQALRLGGLTPAEEAYARGLLAGTVPEALRHFRQSLEHDPLHHRANGMLATVLLTIGRRAEARSRIAVAELLFPEDPTFPVLHALLEALEGNPAAASAALKRAGSQLRGKQMAAAQALVDFQGELHAMEKALAGAARESYPALVWRFASAALRLRVAVRSWGKEQGGGSLLLLLPVPPVLAQTFGDFSAAVPLALLGGKPDRALRELEQAAVKYPNSMIYLVQGLLLAQHDRWEEAEKQFLQAEQTTSVIDVHPAARFCAACSEWVLSQRGPPSLRPEMKRRAGRHLRATVARGTVSPEQAGILSDMATDLGEAELARWILREWQRQSPGDPRVLEQRARLEFRAGAYGRAVELIDEVLAGKPKDAKSWRNLRGQAASGLTRQAQAANRAE
jgi:Flp pilus assembly protein TadD